MVCSGFGFGLATLEPIIEVKIADGAQGQVVVVGSSNGCAQFFVECVQGVQVRGRGSDFKPAGAQEFLIAAVDQRGNLAANQAAGPDNVGRAAVWRFGQDRAAAVFADLDPICCAGSVHDIKPMRTKICHGAIEGLGGRV